MKQVLAYMVVGTAGALLAGAVVVGEPAHADLAVVQVATQPLPDLLAGMD